jgi:hypothetical protein
MATKDAIGMVGIRSRNDKGPLRELRNDMLVKNFEKKYNVDFGVRGDMEIGNLQKRLGVENVKDLLATLK